MICMYYNIILPLSHKSSRLPFIYTYMPPPNPLMSKASYAGLGAVRIFLLEGRNCMDSLSTACFYWGHPFFTGRVFFSRFGVPSWHRRGVSGC